MRRLERNDISSGNGNPTERAMHIPGGGNYRSMQLREVWKQRNTPAAGTVLILWLLSTAASIGLGLASVIYSWSGLPLHFGGVDVYITVYPPLLICMWWSFCFGLQWGVIPAYASTLVLALYSGMPWPWALLFAWGNPVGLAVQIAGYRAIAMPRALNSWPALVFFVQMAFTGSIFSSAAAMIWCYTNKIDKLALIAIWQGWWLGGFLQSVLLVGPLLALSWHRVAKWQDKHPSLIKQQPTDSKRLVLRLLAVLVAGVLAYGYANISLATAAVTAPLMQGGHAYLVQATTMLSSMTWIFFWVIAMVALLLGMIAYQLFSHWQKTNQLLISELASANADLAIKASSDSLTGLANHQTITQTLANDWASGQHRNSTLLMLDIDLFKYINDEFGHLAGDQAICRVAMLLRQELRGVDFAGRYGGEEFVVLLRGMPRAADAFWTADRIRERIAATVLGDAGRPIKLTVSIGLATPVPEDKTFEDWLRRADDALYKAKRSGRNQVVVAD